MSDRSLVKWKIAVYCAAVLFGGESVGVCAAPKAAPSQDSPVAAQGDEPAYLDVDGQAAPRTSK